MTNIEKRKILIIINPVAGKGRTVEIIPKLKEKMEPYKGIIEYKILLSNYAGEITSIARQHYDLGFREFIAVGGDGTLSELINGFDLPIDENIKIGILPLGTGNDFVKSICDTTDIDGMIESVIQNRTKRIDIGLVNDFKFINVCSFGIDGPIIKDTEKYKKVLPGQFAYLFSTLKAGLTFNPKKVHVDVDGQTYDGNMILIAIANGKYFGGGMNICPDAILDDGVFDICLVKDVSKLKFMREISKVYSGRLGEVEEVKYIKGSEINIKVVNGSYLINVDGNLVGKTPVKINIIKKAIQVYI